MSQLPEVVGTPTTSGPLKAILAVCDALDHRNIEIVRKHFTPGFRRKPAREMRHRALNFADTTLEDRNTKVSLLSGLMAWYYRLIRFPLRGTPSVDKVLRWGWCRRVDNVAKP